MKKYVHIFIASILCVVFIVFLSITSYFALSGEYKDGGQSLLDKQIDKIAAEWMNRLKEDINRLENTPLTHIEKSNVLCDEYVENGDMVFMVYRNSYIKYYNYNDNFDKSKYYEYREYKTDFDGAYWYFCIYVKKEPRNNEAMYDNLHKTEKFVGMKNIFLVGTILSFLILTIYTVLSKDLKKAINELKLWLKVLMMLAAVSLYEIVFYILTGTIASPILYIEKLLVYVLLVFAAIEISRITKATNEIANGNIDYKITKKNRLSFTKRQSDNLELIGKGIKVAVDDSIKSERFKTALITNVTHDLKTPLTSIVNYVDLLKKYGDDKEKSQEYVEILERQSGKLRTLIEDLVEASKASTGNVKVNKTPLNINVLLGQALAEYSGMFENKGLELDVELDENMVEVETDSMLMWRIFDNLLNNVYKYAKEDTRVYVQTMYSNDVCSIVLKNVSKNKLNITKEELMERFVRGDESRNTEGNGLGLSIIKGFTEALGGTYDIIIDGDLFKTVLEFKF